MALPMGAVGADWLQPPWDLAGIGALATSRNGGVSGGLFTSLNLGDAVGDAPEAVAVNRERLCRALGGAQPVYLRQVHGREVVLLESARGAGLASADASVTAVPGVACIVQAADCLPVLFAAPDRRGVAAAHAGWRGLAAGVLEAAVDALCRVSDVGPTEIQAWLGPSIGPSHFEVGADVVDAFRSQAGDGCRDAAIAACFVAKPPLHALGQGGAPGAAKWLADLGGLARLRLEAAGVRQISGGGFCTFADASRFFSFRRDQVCGRMAAAVWIR